MGRGRLIIFEGPDKSGKTTQIELLRPHLQERGYPVRYTKEPGGIEPARRAILSREWLLSDKYPRSTALSDFFLFFSARADHFENALLPLLAAGTHVIMDRGDASTYAFQIFGEERKDLDDLFVHARRAVFKNWKPDCYIIFDLPTHKIEERIRNDPKGDRTHFDMRPRAFHDKVRNGYRAFAKRFEGTQDPPTPSIFVLDGDRSPGAVHEDVLAAVEYVLLRT